MAFPCTKLSSTMSSSLIVDYCISNHLASCSQKLPVVRRSTSSRSISQPFRTNYSYRSRYYSKEEEDEKEDEEDYRFEEAVSLFNKREYYKCHDVLEALWMRAEDPARTLFHGILQCAVGFHHLFNQNHKGAMMELGEGVCKLRKLNFGSGPFHEFEQQISGALHFIYMTQIELAACTEDVCLTMDRSERSYQLLGSYGAAQHLYALQPDDENHDSDATTNYIVFVLSPKLKVKLPTLNATQQHLQSYGIIS